MNKLIVILGPTASGKTELAVKLAKEFSGEIVCADSRQVYKEMDIATAKPLQNQKARPPRKPACWRCGQAKIKNQKYLIEGIPHHLFGIVSPNEEFNVAIYKELAVKTIKDIQNRGKLPFLVGGTGLYIKAVVENFKFPGVAPHPKLREKLRQKSVKELFEVYKKLDPKGAEHIEKNNKRRLIRALEVCKITGKSFWEQRGKGKPLFQTLQIGIKLPKAELKNRISKRVEKMFNLGLEKEVKNLVQKYGWEGILSETIGYQEFKAFFEKERTLEQVKQKITDHTSQFSRRQMTWFKRDSRIRWIENYDQAKKLIKEFLEN